MTPGAFCWYQLRTTDTKAAQAFYADVLGPRIQIAGSPGAAVLRAGEQPVGAISVLPERAAAMGAPAHWLGHISVRDVDAATRRCLAFGVQQLGPSQQGGGGEQIAILRDPFGAVVALSSRPSPPDRAFVAWHELHTRDREQAGSMYTDVFGWRPTEALEVDLGPEVGPYQMFAWDEGGQSVGGMANTARLPHIHAHWLFYFHVDNIDAALASVRSHGGTVIHEPRVFPGGARATQCEDPQSAIFGLYEPATRTA